jgi:hypothetical protein
MLTRLDTNATVCMAEDTNRGVCLARQNVDQLEQIHLFGVLIRTPLETRTFHVLAPSAEEAIDQARCAAGCPTYANTFGEDEIKASAQQLPLYVRGWGKQTF